MHELSIAQAVAEIATRHAEGRRVTRVGLAIGHLRQVVPSALEFSFTLVAEGTVLEGARLEMVMVPVVSCCRACGTTTEMRDFPFLCGNCHGSELDIIAGNELMVESLDLEETEIGTYSH
jgi:hydrogenase nickel incorporation protein HypA/HybF